MTIDSSFPFASTGVPGKRVRHGFSMPFPFQGADKKATRHLEVLASLPGCIGLVDPESLTNLTGGYQSLSSLVGGHVWTTPAAETCALETTSGVGKLVTVDAAPFQPDTGVDVQGRQARALVLPRNRWTIITPIKITAAATTRLILGCPDTPSGSSNVRFGLGLTSSDAYSLFNFTPGTASRTNGGAVTEGSLEVWAITFSIENGVNIFKGESTTPNKTDAAETTPLAADEIYRIVQLFGHTATGGNGAAGSYGAMCFYDQDYSSSAYLNALATAQATLADYYGL